MGCRARRFKDINKGQANHLLDQIVGNRSFGRLDRPRSTGFEPVTRRIRTPDCTERKCERHALPFSLAGPHCWAVMKKPLTLAGTHLRRKLQNLPWWPGMLCRRDSLDKNIKGVTSPEARLVTPTEMIIGSVQMRSSGGKVAGQRSLLNQFARSH